MEYENDHFIHTITGHIINEAYNKLLDLLELSKSDKNISTNAYYSLVHWINEFEKKYKYILFPEPEIEEQLPGNEKIFNSFKEFLDSLESKKVSQ